MIWWRPRRFGPAAWFGAGREASGLPRPTPAPIAVQHTPGSILANPGTHTPLFIGARKRLATCSGVAWFHGDHIATVNLLGNAVHTYRFDAARRDFSPVQALADMAGLAQPENLAVSGDGRLLAITNAANGAVNLYPVDERTHLIDPAPAAAITCGEDINTHGVSISPCSRFLAYTTVDEPGFVRVCRIQRDAHGGARIEAWQALANPLRPLKPKGIDFSPDGQFVAVCYAANAGHRPRRVGARLRVHAFDPVTGLDPRPLSEGGTRLGIDTSDDLAFAPDASYVVLSNQGSDSVVVVGVDPATGTLRGRRATLENPQARLSFPHGVAISRDGKHLAVTSYGDDKLAVYAMEPGAGG